MMDNIKVDLARQDNELRSDGTRTATPSDSCITDLQTQIQTSHGHSNDNPELQVYFLAVGTVKRDVKGVFKSIPSEVLHKRLLDKIITVIDGIACISILAHHHIEHEIVLHDGISQTQQWGSIHHCYVKVIGSKSIAYGAAGLIGSMLRQDAIGIYHPLTKDDQLILNSNQDQPLPDNFHRYFTIYSTRPILFSTILKIIENVCKSFSTLSGQLDTLGQTIEFHDFDSSFKGTSAQIEAALKEDFQELFPVKTHISKSTVLKENEYQEALYAAGLKINR
ncbi:hypothetical protein I4U23_023810 [Adineta vaga]|nr:hypothetical protein I4U23_023810 [Adineta vaga]